MSSRVKRNIISCDNHLDGFTICISNVRDVYSVGKQTQGAHGHKEEQVFHVTQVSLLKNIQSIDCGKYHTLCLDINGFVFTFGSNEYGQLGIGKDLTTLPFTDKPQKVDIPLIISISCGGMFSMCLSENKELYTFGNNEHGELGLGNNHAIFNSPQKLVYSFLKDIAFFECGGGHTLCCTLDNQVYVWGKNIYGELGIPIIFRQNTPILCKNFPNNIVDIKCGDMHTLFLTSNQEVYSCGYNYTGQLGRMVPGNYSWCIQKIQDLSKIIQIECGLYHSICIDIEYNLYIFGANGYGQLGLEDKKNIQEPIKHPSLSNIIDVSSRGNHTFVKTYDNEIYTFGKNGGSQLGITTEDDKQFTPIRVFEDNEDIWHTSANKLSKVKSARK